MKDQYVGDLSDYRKYGLLRGLCDGADLRLAICWMKTPDDSTGHGGATGYLAKPKLRSHDPDLFDALKRLDPTIKKNRLLSNVEKLGVLPSTIFISGLVPESIEERVVYGEEVGSRCADHDLVFFDPDNGVATSASSTKTRRSAKHVYLAELDLVWAKGCSVLTYQTLRRKPRETFIPELVEKLEEGKPTSRTFVFTAGHVGFFLVSQPRHANLLGKRADALSGRWSPQIKIWKKDDVERT